jgi:hypothetical protein
MLRELAGSLADTFSRVATRNKNFFLNDIPEDLCIDTDSELVATVMSGLMYAVVRNAKESCIRLSAKTYGNVVLVHVKDCNNSDYCQVETGLKQLMPVAEKMGGCVSVTSQRHKVATFAFTFPNLPMAA